VKMQVRHIHAGIDCTCLQRLGRKIIDVSDFESIARGGADNGSDRLAIESECVPAILIHGVQREGYDVIPGSHLWRFRQGILRPRHSCENDVRRYEQGDAGVLSRLVIRGRQFHHFRAGRRTLRRSRHLKTEAGPSREVKPPARHGLLRFRELDCRSQLARPAALLFADCANVSGHAG
jgi:hypothetical protein